MPIRERALFLTDSYETRFEARVETVSETGVTLNHTYFYPTSGGQVHDTGVIGAAKVIDVMFNDDGKDIVHRVDPLDALIVGQEVACRIDWERRYRCMRLHTTQHLLYCVFRNLYGSVAEVGGAITPEKCRLGLAWFGEKPDKERIEHDLEQLIASDTAVATTFSSDDPASLNREWRVEGLEPIPCGGTHVQRLGEIGQVAIKLEKKGRQGIRLTAVLRDV